MRCTTILHPIRKKYPNHEIWWLTDYPEILRGDFVEKIIKFSPESLFSLSHTSFDIVYSLDKEIVCASLAGRIEAPMKKGFCTDGFKILPFDEDAEYLWRRGIDDEKMKADKRHYLDEIFEVCGFTFAEEPYILPVYSIPKIPAAQLSDARKIKKAIVGLNTGTSITWKTRLWKESHWQMLIESLIEQDFQVVLLG